ncbi:hypothetical protein IWX47DRAFT_682644 [Phyllosticta citricarpa]
MAPSRRTVCWYQSDHHPPTQQPWRNMKQASTTSDMRQSLPHVVLVTSTPLRKPIALRHRSSRTEPRSLNRPTIQFPSAAASSRCCTSAAGRSISTCDSIHTRDYPGCSCPQPSIIVSPTSSKADLACAKIIEPLLQSNPTVLSSVSTCILTSRAISQGISTPGIDAKRRPNAVAQPTRFRHKRTATVQGILGKKRKRII